MNYFTNSLHINTELSCYEVESRSWSPTMLSCTHLIFPLPRKSLCFMVEEIKPGRGVGIAPGLHVLSQDQKNVVEFGCLTF